MSDHNLTVTKFKSTWNKYANNETMKITSSSGIYQAKYQNGRYLLFGIRKRDKFGILYKPIFIH